MTSWRAAGLASSREKPSRSVGVPQLMADFGAAHPAAHPLASLGFAPQVTLTRARFTTSPPAGFGWVRLPEEREDPPTPGTYRGTMTSFMLLRQSPRLRLRVAQSFACLGLG